MKIRIRKEHVLQAGLIILVATAMSGCADSVSIDTGITEVGFWRGLWHGMILPFSWLVSLFSDSASIYAIYNNGGWYDFGFVIGAGALTSGGTAASKGS